MGFYGAFHFTICEIKSVLPLILWSIDLWSIYSIYAIDLKIKIFNMIIHILHNFLIKDSYYFNLWYNLFLISETSFISIHTLLWILHLLIGILCYVTSQVVVRICMF